MDKDYDVLFRIMILGDTGVGKTCLLHRFCNEEFRYNHVCTIGIDFKMKTIEVEGIRIRVQIWDTAGQERYRTITKQYYRKGQGVILAYDITNEASFLSIRKWASDVSEYGDENVRTILVGNKSDREDSRVVTTEQGQQLAEEYGMPFFEASAYTDDNVSELFSTIAQHVLEANRNEVTLKRMDTSFISDLEDSEDEGFVQDVTSSADTSCDDASKASCCALA